MKQLILFIFLFPFLLSAQDKTIDFLKVALLIAKHDTTRCNILNKLIEFENDSKIWMPYNYKLQDLAEKNSKTATNAALKKIYLKHLSSALNNKGFLCEQEGEIAKALDYYQSAMKLQEEVNDEDGFASSLHNMAFIYRNEGESEKALDYNFRALKIRTKINNKAGMVNSLNTIGIIFDQQGNIPKALEYYHKALKISEDIKDKKGIASTLNNIGNLYSIQRNYKLGVEYFTRSLKLYKETNDTAGIALVLTNIGFIHLQKEEFLKALDHYQRSLTIREKIGDKKGIAHNLNDIGFVYDIQHDYRKAITYFERSLILQEEINDKSGKATSLNNLGDAMLQLGHINEAFEYANRSMKVAKELGFPEDIMCAAITLKGVYRKQNKYKEALAMYEIQIRMRDSIESDEAKKAGIKKQLQYQYEKKAAADSVKNAEEQKVKNALLTAQHAQLKQEKTQRFSLYGGLCLVIVFLGFVFNRFRITQKQKATIEDQKILVDNAFKHLEEKNKEVMDSIRYAKRIQTALLPNEKYIERKLNELN